jgi:DNA-binding IclR family transcriptional regulator
MASDNLNKSVIKALEIIEALDAEGAMGITEISGCLSMDKSSVFRALNTLKSKHYVRQDPDTLKYSNSYKLFEMGHNVARGTGLPKMAYRFLRELSRKVDGAVSLGVRDGVRAVYIDKIESDATVRVSMKIGQSLPLYCTGMGKALLAWMPDWKLQGVLEDVEFIKNTANTLDSAEALSADLAAIRQRGYSIDDEEHIPGLFCVAAPVFNASGTAIAAISVANVKMMLPDQSAVDNLARLVMGAAGDFTASLGGIMPENL